MGGLAGLLTADHNVLFLSLPHFAVPFVLFPTFSDICGPLPFDLTFHGLYKPSMLGETSLGLEGSFPYFTHVSFALLLSEPLAFGNVVLCCMLSFLSFATCVAGV